MIRRGLAALAAALIGATSAQGQDLAKWSGVWTRAPGQAASFDPATPRKAAPYKPSWLAEFAKRPKAEVARTTPADENCLPEGMPVMMNLREPMELVPQVGSLVIIAQHKGAIRRIFLDGRKHPDDQWATFMGHSVGHWEGRVLVVDTIRMRTDLPFAGALPSDDMRVVERFRLTGPNTLEDQITVTDPKAFTKAWSVTKTYVRAPGGRIKEEVCKG